MSKIIAAINMTLDGFCDHTAMIADDEIHLHYSNLLRNAGATLYGRITYLLMQSFWPSVVSNPTGNRSLDEFAVAIDNIPKIVFSTTLTNIHPSITGWKTATLGQGDLAKEVSALRQFYSGKDILVGSRSLIVALTELNLIDEYQLCVHPVLAGRGLPLFNNISNGVKLKLANTKTFGSGAIVLYYNPSL